MSFSSGMINVATNLIDEFGAMGTLILNDNQIDPITGEKSGTSSEIPVQYFRTYYEDNELIENRIINGDARIIFVLDKKPETNWSFIDSDGLKWAILSITPTEGQGVNIVYEAHIRK